MISIVFLHIVLFVVIIIVCNVTVIQFVILGIPIAINIISISLTPLIQQQHFCCCDYRYTYGHHNKLHFYFYFSPSFFGIRLTLRMSDVI